MDPDFQLFSSLRYDPILRGSKANSECWSSGLELPSPFYMLPYHRDRILQAAQHFGWTKAAAEIDGPQGLERLQNILSKAIGSTETVSPLRLKVLLDHNGRLSVESSPIAELSIENLFPSRIPPPSEASQPAVSSKTGGAMTIGTGESVHGDPKKDYYEVVPNITKTTPTSFTSYKTSSREMYDDARVRASIASPTDKKEVMLVSDRDGALMEGSLTSLYFWREGKWVTPNTDCGGQIGTSRRWALEKGLCIEGLINIDSLIDGEECWISNGVRGFIAGKIKLR